MSIWGVPAIQLLSLSPKGSYVSNFIENFQKKTGTLISSDGTLISREGTLISNDGPEIFFSDVLQTCTRPPSGNADQ